MASVTVSEARARLPELLARVNGGEQVTIIRHGRLVAVLVRRTCCAPAALADAERIHDLPAATRAIPLPASSGLTTARAEELIREIRAGRETR